MNHHQFKNPWLQQQYTLNQTTYMINSTFPLYAWENLKVALRGKKRYSYLYILECHASKFYGQHIYNVTTEHSLIMLRQPNYKEAFLVDLFTVPSFLGIALCSTITPLRCLG